MCPFAFLFIKFLKINKVLDYVLKLVFKLNFPDQYITQKEKYFTSNNLSRLNKYLRISNLQKNISSLCLPRYLYIYPFHYVNIYLSIYLSIYLFIYQSIYLSS